MADEDNTNSSAGSGPTPSQPSSSNSGISKVVNHMLGNKIEAGLWMTRCFTIVATFLFFLPITGSNPNAMYRRVLLANAATSALRLHQRLPHFQLSWQFLTAMFIEDSAHYLFFSLVFVMGAPITMALVPIFLFAVLHATSYTKTLLNQMGPTSGQIIRNLITKIESQQQNILRFIACSEIFLMPMIVVMCFSGMASLMQPFIYGRFLSLRYSSRRNPYCRQLFYELSMGAQQICYNQRCPRFVSNLVTKVIGLIGSLAPVVQPAQQ